MNPPKAGKDKAKPLSPNHVKHLRSLLKTASVPRMQGGYHPLLVPQADSSTPAGQDDQLIGAKTGEYVVPQPVVNRKGTQFFDNLVKKTMEEIMNPVATSSSQPTQDRGSAPLQGQPLDSEQPQGYAEGGDVIDKGYGDKVKKAKVDNNNMGDPWNFDPRELEFSPEEEIKYQMRDKLIRDHAGVQGFALGGQVGMGADGWQPPAPLAGSNMPDDYLSNNYSNPNPYGGGPMGNPWGLYGGTEDRPQGYYNPFTGRGGRMGNSGNNFGGRRHIYGGGDDQLPGDKRWASRQINPYNQPMPGGRHVGREGFLSNYDPQGLHDIFNPSGVYNGGRNDRINSWLDASGVHVNADQGGGGTGGIPNSSGVGSPDNPSFIGGSPSGTSSNQPSGYDARGNPVWGGQAGGFNIPGGIGLSGLGQGSHGDTGFYGRFTSNQIAKSLQRGRRPWNFQTGGRMNGVLPLNKWGGGWNGGGSAARFGPNARQMSGA